jgi:hypothetical protein
MPRIKGPIFPSFANQQEPKPRQQWVSHDGKRQRLRYLRRVCSDILTSSDPEVVEILKQAREFVAGKYEEYGMLMMIHQALEASDSTGMDFPFCLDYILDKMRAETSALTVEQEKTDVSKSE